MALSDNGISFLSSAEFGCASGSAMYQKEAMDSLFSILLAFIKNQTSKTGKYALMSLPRPTSLKTCKKPPAFFTMPMTVANPRPVP